MFSFPPDLCSGLIRTTDGCNIAKKNNKTKKGSVKVGVGVKIFADYPLPFFVHIIYVRTIGGFWGWLRTSSCKEEYIRTKYYSKIVWGYYMWGKINRDNLCEGY